jgi:hypothetical protein
MDTIHRVLVEKVEQLEKELDQTKGRVIELRSKLYYLSNLACNRGCITSEARDSYQEGM